MEDTDGLTVILSPVQLEAILTGGALEAREITTNRLWGGLKLLGGALELAGAGVLFLVPEPTMVTKVGGGVLAAHGTDTFAAGIHQIWTGHPEKTLTEQAGTAGARMLGANQRQAEIVGVVVDVGVPLIASIGATAARITAIRAGRVVLAEEEAVGGHTIARHVARTEEQLQARLTAEARIPAASSFQSVRVAESVISDAFRVNAGQIRSWAAGAGNLSRMRIVYTAEKAVGYGVVRATGKLEDMRKVLIVLQKTSQAGKAFFILTAYPIP
jgi:hypothetical protein